MQRVLILATTTSYRADDFRAAAARLGVEPVLATNRCHVLAELWTGDVPIELRDAETAAAAVIDEARLRAYDAIVATDDRTAEVAALAQAALGQLGNAPAAARTAGNKRLLREALQRHGVRTPRHQVFSFVPGESPDMIARRLRYPVVLKPLLLSASRGVMRADDAAEFVVAWRRLVALLATPEVGVTQRAEPDGRRVLVEEFVSGVEVAIEAILRRGELTVLAIFDKPDPHAGPFFEETIYVTPSRHSAELQAALAEATGAAARAIGLTEGPVHAELRVGADGKPYVIEVAARSIGGLCARTLRFGLDGVSLEEVVLSAALGRPLPTLHMATAAGVMMIPIPRAGVLGEVTGIEQARAVPLVEDVAITALPGRILVPLPEGHAYLGFVFARGPTPAAVEEALRRAHAHLHFAITATLPKI